MLPKAAGYLLYRQANLDHELDSRLTTWLAGDFSLDNVTANLRRLERVVAERGKKVFWADSPDAPEEEPEEGYAEPYLTLFDEGGWPDDFEDEDPNFVYLNEGGLLEEDEVADA